MSANRTDVRPAEDRDLPGIARIAFALDQHECGGDPRYVDHLRRHGRFLVAESEGRIVGYGAALPVGSATMLSDLFVDPARHGAGIGRSVLDVIFDGTQDRMTFSSQNPRALPLYIRYGMVPRWPLLYLRSPAGDAADSPCKTRTVSANEAAALEQTFTGIDRSADYAFWTDRPGGTGIVVEDAGVAVAAGAVGDRRLRHLTMGREDAGDAVTAALRDLVGVALPGPNPALPRLVEARWRIEDLDYAMATRDGLLDHRHVPSASLA